MSVKFAFITCNTVQILNNKLKAEQQRTGETFFNQGKDYRTGLAIVNNKTITIVINC